MYVYRIYGLTISMPMSCPMLVELSKDTPVDIFVKEGIVPDRLIEAKIVGDCWQASSDRFLYIAGNRAGKYLIEGTNSIIFEKNTGAIDDALCLHLITYAIAALMRQRGMIVLHANSVLTPFGAVAISGESGSGKSTTQAALLKQQCLMISDDITALTIGSDSYVYALPGPAKMNLYSDVAQYLNTKSTSTRRNPVRPLKLMIHVNNESMVTEASMLKKIYCLNIYDGDKPIKRKLTGIEKFVALQNCLYGPQFENKLNFESLSCVASKTDIYQLSRPRNKWSIDDLVGLILGE